MSSVPLAQHSLIPSLTLPDPDHRHVRVAAADGSNAIIYNLTVLPAQVLKTYDIDAQHPDEMHGFGRPATAKCRLNL